MTVGAGYAEFEFDLPEALLERLIVALKKIEPIPLTSAALAEVPDVQGVYELSYRGNGENTRVYIGKTDSAAGLRRRLRKHAKKIQHRVGLEPTDVYFKAMRVFVFTAIDLEAQLIAHFGGVKEVDWQGSGFGANDPGKERDTTTYKDDHFDGRFPIDVGRPLEFDLPKAGTAAGLLRQLKQKLPYLIRFQTISKHSRVGHPDLEETEVVLPSEAMTPASAIADVVRQLPKGWHATLLPSHIIIYKDDDRKFPSGRLLAKS